MKSNIKDLWEHIEYKLNIYKNYNIDKIEDLVSLCDVIDGCLSIEEDTEEIKELVKSRIYELKQKEGEIEI